MRLFLRYLDRGKITVNVEEFSVQGSRGNLSTETGDNAVSNFV